MTLPALSVTDRHALKALTLETSTIIEPSQCWLCHGRDIVAFRALDKIPFPLPRNVDRWVVSAREVEAVKEWLG